MQVKQEIIQKKIEARDEELSNFRDDKFLFYFEGVVLCLCGAALKIPLFYCDLNENFLRKHVN